MTLFMAVCVYTLLFLKILISHAFLIQTNCTLLHSLYHATLKVNLKTEYTHDAHVYF